MSSSIPRRHHFHISASRVLELCPVTRVLQFDSAPKPNLSCLLHDVCIFGFHSEKFEQNYFFRYLAYISKKIQIIHTQIELFLKLELENYRKCKLNNKDFTESQRNHQENGLSRKRCRCPPPARIFRPRWRIKLPEVSHWQNTHFCLRTVWYQLASCCGFPGFGRQPVSWNNKITDLFLGSIAVSRFLIIHTACSE